MAWLRKTWTHCGKGSWSINSCPLDHLWQVGLEVMPTIVAGGFKHVFLKTRKDGPKKITVMMMMMMMRMRMRKRMRMTMTMTKMMMMMIMMMMSLLLLLWWWWWWRSPPIKLLGLAGNHEWHAFSNSGQVQEVEKKHAVLFQAGAWCTCITLLQQIFLQRYCDHLEFLVYPRQNRSSKSDFKLQLLRPPISTGRSLPMYWCLLSYPLVNEHRYWKWPFIVDFPIKNGDFP